MARHGKNKMPGKRWEFRKVPPLAMDCFANGRLANSSCSAFSLGLGCDQILPGEGH